RDNSPELFHTSDSGKTWTKVLDGHSHYASLFKNFVITGMSFANASTGWFTGTPDTTNQPYTHPGKLYVTHDSGKTWQEQTLPPLQGHVLATIWTPQFFTSQDGVLPVLFNDTMGVDIFVTHDGGITWKSTRFVPLPPPHSDIQYIVVQSRDEPPQFTDMEHGWVVGGDNTGKVGAGVFYITSDGGQHWTEIIPDKNSRPAILDVMPGGPDFTSAQNGWILANTKTSENGGQGSTVLYETNDGGRTWIQVHAMFPGYIVPKSAF
ncbi:MAG TPA: hypothetical protein VGN34_13935, partial [Ktedonobacteraceae bacterium]